MKTYITLLRGINVGGHKKILMADLRELLEMAGLIKVKTYIQSGNLIFFSYAESSENEQIITEAIHKNYGWEVPAIVKTPSDLKEIIDNCPFSGEKKKKSYFTLLSDEPNEEDINEVQMLSNHHDEFFITKTCIYFWSDNYARSKFNNNFFERKLKVNATARNYRTMMKLIDLSS